MEFNVKKRSGAMMPYDISKIKERIRFACDGLDIDEPLFESTASLSIREGISTVEIQKSLISTALNLADITHEGSFDFTRLNFRFVAARLLHQDIFKSVYRNRGQAFDDFGYSKETFYKHIKKAVSNGIYNSVLTKTYNKNDFLEIGNEIEAHGIKYDHAFDYAAMNLLDKRYLIRHQGGLYELPQEMFGIVALLLASIEEPEDRIKWAKKYYHVLASRKLSLATPFLANLRKVNGNLSSCFIVAMDDSLDSIDWTEDMVSQISKNGGGVGVNMSRIRASGSWMQGHKGLSGGVIPWIKKLNDIAIAVSQAANKRSGAITPGLDIWHYDIFDFMELKTETGDPRRKAFDVFPQVIVPDLFMKRVQSGKNWSLFDPYEVRIKYGVELTELWGSEFEKIYKELEKDKDIELTQTVSARELWTHILKTALETGLPYVIFKDTINKLNPNKNSGMISQANLCVESYSNFSPSNPKRKVVTKKGDDAYEVKWIVDAGYAHTCNLASIVYSNIEDKEEAYQVSRLATRILDNAISLTDAPIPEADIHNDDYRIIGIGAMGLADYLAVRDLPYGSKKALKESESLSEIVALGAVTESVELARVRGKYPKYEGSDFSKNIFFGKSTDDIISSTCDEYKNRWEQVFKLQSKNGMRHGSLLAIAPNTSTSPLMGATASIWPPFRKFFVDASTSGNVPLVPPSFNQENIFSYQENRHINQKRIIETCASVQKWVDQGISMELLLNLNREEPYTAKEINDLYFYSWKKGCKTVYYLRSMSKKAEAA